MRGRNKLFGLWFFGLFVVQNRSEDGGRECGGDDEVGEKHNVGGVDENRVNAS